MPPRPSFGRSERRASSVAAGIDIRYTTSSRYFRTRSPLYQIKKGKVFSFPPGRDVRADAVQYSTCARPFPLALLWPRLASSARHVDQQSGADFIREAGHGRERESERAGGGPEGWPWPWLRPRGVPTRSCRGSPCGFRDAHGPIQQRPAGQAMVQRMRDSLPAFQKRTRRDETTARSLFFSIGERRRSGSVTAPPDP